MAPMSRPGLKASVALETIHKLLCSRRSELLTGKGHLVLTDQDLGFLDEFVVEKGVLKHLAGTGVDEVHLHLVGEILGVGMTFHPEFGPANTPLLTS